MIDVFISYAREDRRVVENMAALLEQTGWKAFWDRQIRAGTSFDRVIERAVADARAVIVVWSKHSVDSEWVRGEASLALDLKKPLLPVRLDDAAPPLRFRYIETADLSGWKGQSEVIEWKRLVDDLIALLGEPRRPAESVDQSRQSSERGVPAERRRWAVPPIRKFGFGVLLVSATFMGAIIFRLASTTHDAPSPAVAPAPASIVPDPTPPAVAPPSARIRPDTPSITVEEGDHLAQVRRIALLDYVDGLAKHDPYGLDQISKSLGVAILSDKITQRNETWAAISGRVKGKTSMDALSTQLRPITHRDF